MGVCEVGVGVLVGGVGMGLVGEGLRVRVRVVSGVGVIEKVEGDDGEVEVAETLRGM